MFMPCARECVLLRAVAIWHRLYAGGEIMLLCTLCSPIVDGGVELYAALCTL